MKKNLYLIIPAVLLGLFFLTRSCKTGNDGSLQHQIDSLNTASALSTYKAKRHESAAAALQRQNDSLQLMKNNIHQRYEAQQAQINKYSAAVSKMKSQLLMVANNIDTTKFAGDSLICYTATENNFLLIEASKLSECDSINKVLTLQVKKSESAFLEEAGAVSDLRDVIKNDSLVLQKKDVIHTGETKDLKKNIRHQKIYKWTAIILGAAATSLTTYFYLKKI